MFPSHPPALHLPPTTLPHAWNRPAFPEYRTSLQLRQEQAEAFYRTQHNHSRASSSTGSVANSLRRTPNFERARSVEPSQQQQRVRFETPRPYSTEPHPALRISRRTASAIRFVLEEGLRVPHPFTPDLVEENARMSDLTSGRAANGGARTTGGPVPVDRSNIRTPTQIMNARRQRAEVEEQRKAAEEERRRVSAERRAQAVSGVAGAPTTEPGAQRQPQSAPRSGDQYVQYPTSSGGVPRQPERPMPSQNTTTEPQETSIGASQSRPRAASQSHQPSRPTQANLGVPTTSEQGRRPPGSGHGRRPSGAASTSQAGASTAAQPRPPPAPGSSSGQARESTTSNFPHAFERWETLSSHWEGLTSYWIRRLEQNTDEVRREPLAQQMSRQITDLSAAGANLFHAVVELQRLRASSERKFQRWFYEHRQDQEKAQEREAQLREEINKEHEARLEAEANMERMATEKKNAERAVTEMKRELQISKEEARRAWEELGRREQEERDRTFSLREGQPTLVGGVQVVPMAQNMGRGGRGHGEDTYAGAQSSGSGIEAHYSYEEGPQSPTDTDPFTETGRHGRQESEIPGALAQGTYVPSGAASSSSSRPGGASSAADSALAPAPLQYPYYTSQAQQNPTQPAMSQPEAFYQQPGSYLHQESESGLPEDEQSYVTSQADESEADVEYALDERGNYIRDESGRRIPFRSLQSPVSDDYDVEEARQRELEHLQNYGTGASSQGGYVTTSNAGASPSQGYTTQPDYSGDGYGDEWVGMRHHHPTRLSDVPEEDERSRTSPSRASQASRGRLY
ncbi:Essential protein Yae1 [Stemphylium lycopersici]|uniref:Essential protein Yae1 n=1 Tax=Stemphylium lycopersici TaxID=183478 RepID=A0A364NDZ7_STELY|nr:Essential protein Yae1 [Stemphylium lycopersici]